MFSDIDFNGYANYPAIDTLNQLVYCWSDSNSSFYKPSEVPAVGYVQLYGPSVPGTNCNSVFCGETKNNSKNLDISSFWGFLDEDFSIKYFNPPYTRVETWNIAKGFDKLGNVIKDPATGKPVKFMYSGDPVANSGWLSNSYATGGGAGVLFFSGPFNFAPNDTQWVAYALMAAQGEDNYGSITELKRRASLIKNVGYKDYVNFIEIFPFDSTKIIHKIDEVLILQNYPNPFNGATKIRYTVPGKMNVNIEIYNSLGEKIITLIDKEHNTGIYSVDFQNSNLSSGVYFCKLTAGSTVKSIKMVLLK